MLISVNINNSIDIEKVILENENLLIVVKQVEIKKMAILS